MSLNRNFRLASLSAASWLIMQLSIVQCLAQAGTPTDSSAAVSGGSGVASKKGETDEYLDENQRHLGETVSQDFNHYFFFEDKPDFVKAELKVLCKPWSEVEKTEIIGIINKIMKRAPGLVVRAASGERLAFCRVSILPGKTKYHENLHTQAAATTGNSAIVIADLFFHDSWQLDVLAHELVHAADHYCRTAYSKKWIDFANPTISGIRQELERLPPGEFKLFQSNMRKDGRWVSIYGCNNLVEAFAEYFSEYIVGSKFPISQVFLDQIGTAFLLPNTNDLLWLQHVRHGCEYRRFEKYRLACDEFEAAIAIDASAYMPYSFFALSSMYLRDNGATEATLSKGVDCWDKAGIPSSEKNVSIQPLLVARGVALIDRGKYKEASDLFSQALKNEPGVPLFLLERGDCLQSLGFFGDAAKDFYAAKKGELKLNGHAKLANVCLKKGQLKQARKYCESAIKLDKDAIEPRIVLIELEEASGKTTAAREQYEIVKELLKREGTNAVNN